MSFFEQDLIRDELQEMTELYQEIATVMYGSSERSEDERKDCLDKLERLIELQELLYFRAKYSDDAEAEEFVQMLRASAAFLGISPDIDVSQIFIQMKEDVATAKKRLDKSI
jgi:hypothetical protein